MGLVGGLSAIDVAWAEKPEQCPSGTWASGPKIWSVRYGWGWHYLCMKGEPWECELFGINCKGVIPTAIPSPQTQEQMTNPEAWTPEMAAEELKIQEDRNTYEWLQRTEGIGEAIPSEKTIAIAGAGTALLIGGAVVVAILLLKR